LITLQQDAAGFIRMSRHYPAKVLIRIIFTDGSTREFSGLTLNKAYDAALAEFRAKNGLDARGFSRTTAGRTNSGNKIEFVPVHPGMGE
jgi:Mg-chelatase subunit ChlD